jgi:hypothetical protein
MRFFTDQFFTETQKTELLGSGYLQENHSRFHGNGYTQADSKPLPERIDTQKFERSSKHVEYLLIGGILSLYVAVAVLGLLSQGRTLAA